MLDLSVLPLSTLPASLRPTTERHWQQFTESAGDALLQELQGFIQSQPELSSQLARVITGSEFVAKTLITRPALLLELLRDNALSKPLSQVGSQFDDRAIQVEVDNCNSDAELDTLLRRYRQRAMVRLVWRDFTRLADMQETTADVSHLADHTIQLALDYHYRQLCAKFGTPVGRDSGKPQTMVVLGMGKLGASELNVSSDIDLIFGYPESGETEKIEGARKQLSNQEFFVRLGQQLIKSLDANTADGFVFRVDMRLRPYGQSGALALNFDALEEYYQTQGRDWERFAMIKARPVAGDSHFAQQLMEMLRPFTYRQYIDFSAIDALRSTKALINREVQRKGMASDVKLGFGGIREVEFIVQAFQLIRGGRDPRLQERQLLKLLPILEADGYLPAGVGQQLSDVYVLLRNTEHAIQGYQDRQTQALPIDDTELLRLAWVMGHESWESFEPELTRCREVVNAEFQAVIADPESEKSRDDNGHHDWVALWGDALGDEQAHELLEHAGFDEPERVLQLLTQLRESRQVLVMQASSRERLEAFMPRLLAALTVSSKGVSSEGASSEEECTEGEESETKRQAVLAGSAQTLSRIMVLVEAVVRRSAYLVLLVENPAALQQLVRLCAASPWIADQLAKHPALLDELLDARSLYTPPDKETLRDELRQEVLRLSWGDLEAHMEALRYFRLAHGLRVAAAEVAEVLPLMKVSDYLTFIAETILEHVLDLAWEQMVARHGRPGRAEGEGVSVGGAVEGTGVSEDRGFIVVGYGKLGGIELGHGSDLDLVFIHNADPALFTEGRESDGEKSIDNLTFFTRLGQKMIHILNTQTMSGQLYEVDMRLRPSGNSGLLVSSLSAFEKYQLNEAWTWEHQALVRARVVAGSARLARDFEQVRSRILCQPREIPELQSQVIEMREKMREHLGSGAKKTRSNTLQQPKGDGEARNTPQFHLKQDSGGIVDIEFMVQYAVLAWAHQVPALVRWTDNIRILGCLEDADLLGADSVASLIDAYKAYRSLGHRLALQRQAVSIEGSQFTPEREGVTHLWQQLLEQ